MPLLGISPLLMLVAASAAPMTSGASPPAGNNLLWNGTFDGHAIRPWSLAFENSRDGAAVSSPGELCVRIDRPGANTFSVALRQGPLAIERGHHYQVRFRTHASRRTQIRPKASTAGIAPVEMWNSLVTADSAPVTYAATFDGPTDSDRAELVFEMGGGLAGQVPLTVCLDDVELNDPQFEVPNERLHPPSLPAVRVNQVGYLPGLAKTATVVTDAPAPLEWRLADATGKTRATGKTQPFGEDKASGDAVHIIDFSAVTETGKGWKLRVSNGEGKGDGMQSDPFEIGPDVYRRLKYDALSFFYLQRSGMEIKMPFAGNPIYARPAGHPQDKNVPCAREAGCAYSLDVSGGWYDAGDHGKYVVNSAISVWTLLNQWETLQRFGTSAADFADGKMKVPEAGNGQPDLLDEARFNLEFMLRMQVPGGQPQAGMVHHKIHGEKWTDLPTPPDKDPVKRYLRPVSSAATYDLAATAAQGARLWRTLDPAFSARCLAAAELAFATARKSPVIRAEKEVQGGGAYGDGDIEDDLYWAATELFVTTGKPGYRDELRRSRFHAPKPVPVTAAVMGWDHVAPLAKLTLAIVPNQLGEAEIAEQRAQLVMGAERFLAAIDKRGYRAPLGDSAYVWGSNSGVMNAGVILGAAYAFTHDTKFANGLVESMNYLLGRNPMGMSYVAGYGTRAMRNPHHRVWAHQKDARQPEAPPGTVSGGPNSMLQDPYIRKLGKSGCPPQTCYVDHVESYSTNEVAINWNAPLAWEAAFLDDLARAAAPRPVTKK